MTIIGDPTSSPPADGLNRMSTEERLREAMNREATRWIDVLDSNQRDDQGNPIFDWKTRREMFQMAQDWLIRSRKLWPHQDREEEGEGITNLRDWMNSPENVASLETMFKARGWLPPPPKKAGRPNKVEAEHRQKFAAQKQAIKEASGVNDDRALQALLKGKIPPSKENDE